MVKELGYKLTSGIVFTLILMFVSHFAKASTYEYDGKQITKGAAIKLLASNPDAKVLKIDQVKFDDEKGTLKNRDKDNQVK